MVARMVWGSYACVNLYLFSEGLPSSYLEGSSRHNALHVAARLGKEEAARLVLHWVVGGDLVGRLYPDEVSNFCKPQNCTFGA